MLTDMFPDLVGDLHKVKHLLLADTAEFLCALYHSRVHCHDLHEQGYFIGGRYKRIHRSAKAGKRHCNSRVYAGS